ncbi:hypothetical protein [Okeania sp. SIO1H2]|nr:hypothetical protein [Okeania sp. SIO1H2]NET15941.1 hypothetical protein [Okeania sp. SIO1H6]NET21533.1 hypothetical protein [Okeania sp. SIO1H5]NET94921.1 hypothetical protein [Okeania sp. SIO1H2]
MNKAKNLSLLGNRQQATGNGEYIGKSIFANIEMHPKIWGKKTALLN